MEFEKNLKPMISIKSDPVLKRRFAIKKSTANTLDEYTEFLSNFYQKEVSENEIIESLIYKLRKDKAFAKWLRSRECS